MRLSANPPDFADLLISLDGRRLLEVMSSGIGLLPEGRYLHWDNLRHRQPPAGFTTPEWWLAHKMARAASRKVLPFKGVDASPFSYSNADGIQQMLHRIDKYASGNTLAPEQVTNPSTRERYLISSLFEEAITSSQLEGAATTREVAKAMLRTGRPPRNSSEQMILNNLRAMEFIREHVGEDLTVSLILELQRIVIEGTLDSSNAAGRLRSAGDRVVIADARDNTVLHTPPDAAELPERLDLLCNFANEALPHKGFLHPVLRAILIHFMVGYDHPFVDGNGRTARALFYWSVARAGYWLLEYVSISTILRRAPSQYARAYLHTETDDNDATYFFDYNLRVILRAIDGLHAYLAQKTHEVMQVESLLDSARVRMALNHRQTALLSHAMKNPQTVFSVRSHQNSHGVSYETARSDLLGLAGLKLLNQFKVGRAMAFRAAEDLQQALTSLRKAKRRRALG